MEDNKNKVILIIADGLGIAAPGTGNAVTLAETPNLDKYWPTNPHGSLYASGNHMGMLETEVGNSQIGHRTIGAGKVILGPHARVSNAFNNNTFKQNPVLLELIENVQKEKKIIHIVSLVSTNSTDVDMHYIYKFLDMVKEEAPLTEVLIHAVLEESNYEDCFDVLEDIESYCGRINKGKIASISGSSFAFDSKRRWKFTKLFYETLTTPLSTEKIIPSWKEYLLQRKEANEPIVDIIPKVLPLFNEGSIIVESRDGILFPCLENKRSTQLIRAFIDSDFIGWHRELKQLYVVSFVEITDTKIEVAFPEEKITETLGSYIADNGLKQLRIAEVEKFIHVTKSFNASNEHPKDEDWIELPALSKSFDTDPRVNYEAFVELVKKHSGSYDFVLMNMGIIDYAAHKGDIDKTVQAVEIVDEALGKIVKIAEEKGITVIFTSDHGNAEIMIDLKTGLPNLNHTSSLVPFLVIDQKQDAKELPQGTLADVAPTVCNLLQLNTSLEMRGSNLLK